ncbi:type II toxin-antitoxin system VapC family toxin [Candidatus Entotheonella palauensis]|uniref:Ribonuclease VapC n=1 Tax=Candidatus Entotheonella gemina TaxID=1429439 RepID=W4M0K7_9BACT|nr:type II toxin-antitoxin system VapC family toxin [Candidatus Entotheonella palauensis]ETX03849.1 MAG: ribonuclease [Candidatus Entotheonella gemina]
MVIDTSAVLAILRDEPERRAFNRAIDADDTRLMSVASFVEASMVMEARHGYEGIRDLDLFVARAEIELVPVDINQAHMARQVFRQYGKGRHPAALNFGDCFTYALAKATQEPLLFKGNDFGQTDIVAVQG